MVDSIKKTCIVLAMMALPGAVMPCHAATYHVRPDGNNANPGTAATAAAAWRSIDRGQPALLLKDIKEGDTEVALSKASQFPEKGILLIGNDMRITYAGRSAQKVTGCQGVKAAKKGSRVSCPDAPPPQAGDTVLVAPGIYAETLAEAPTWADHPLASVVITAGGNEGQPVIFKGVAGAVVDGRDEIVGIAIAASFVTVAGFEVRKGGIWGSRADHIVLRGCSVHNGRMGISLHYCSNPEITGNIVYDIVGAWSEHGINLDACQDALITRNTIATNAHGISASRGSGHRITRNLITWCKTGIVFDAKGLPTNCVIKDNNLWACGQWQWLQRDDNAGGNFYKGVDPLLITGDTHVEPMIVQWTPGKEDFLAPHADSPMVVAGEAQAGALPPASYPDAGHRPGENLVFNPSFESGILGWNISSWMPMAWDQTGWQVIEDPAAVDGRCLELQDLAPGDKAARICVKSQFFQSTKGRPLTLSFRAKADNDTTFLDAGFATPSWQGKSGVGTRLKLTSEWASYTWTTTLPPRFSEYAAALFTTRSGRCRIDAVKVEEGQAATPFSPGLEFASDDRLAMMIAPGCPVTGRILNRTGKDFAGTLRWTLEAPFRGVVARGAEPIKAGSAATTVAIDVMKANPAEGYFLFRHAFVDAAGTELDKGMCRIVVGRHATPCRNQDFFAATPPYSGLIPGPIFDRQAASLAAIGLGTLHLYLGYDRINETISSPKFAKLLDSTEAHRLQWLFTPSDANALTGKATWAPGPGNVGPEAIEAQRSDLGGGVCTDAQLAAWTQAVGLLASTFQGRIKYWEILNEPNTFLTGAEYATVLAATARTLREKDPGARIIGGSVVNAHRRDLHQATMAAPPGTFDAFSYHPYRFGLSNPESEQESYRKALLETKADLAASGHRPEIFLTEEGMGSGLDETRCVGSLLYYDTPISRVDWGEGEIIQAQYLARMYATALGEGCIGYSYHTLPALLWDGLYNPNLGGQAIHAMRERVGNATPRGRTEVGRDHVGYLFESKYRRCPWLGRLSLQRNRTVAVLWAKDAEYATATPVSMPGNVACTVHDMFGFSMPMARQADKASFPLGRELVYLTFDGASAEEIGTLLTNAFSP